MEQHVSLCWLSGVPATKAGARAFHRGGASGDQWVPVWGSCRSWQSLNPRPALSAAQALSRCLAASPV